MNQKTQNDGRVAVPVPALAWEMTQILVAERTRAGIEIKPQEIAVLSYDLVYAHIAEGNRPRVQVAQPELRSPFAK